MPIRATNVNRTETISFADIIRQEAAAAIADVAAELEQAGVEQVASRQLEDMIQVFVTEHDERVRPSHAALHNTQWSPNDPNAPIPPLDYGCRCHLEYRAKSPAAVKRTGLPLAPKNAPQAGEQAFKRFFDGAQTSEQSAQPGKRVTPQDIIGNRSGSLLEEGKIKVSDVFDENLIPRESTTLKNIADARRRGRNVAAVTASTQVLRQTFGITNAVISSVTKEARAIKALDKGLSDQLAIEKALLKTKPGFIGASTEAATARRARIVATRILKVIGSLDQ